MNKTILITRPQNQAGEVASLLEKNGFDVFIEPVLEICRENLLLPNLSGKKIQALIITSANAAKFAFEAIENQNYDKKIKIFAVGKKTAEIFIKSGFENVFFPQKDNIRNGAKDLYDLILADLDLASKNQQEVILYFCGNVITLNFAQELRKKNYLIENILSYKVKEKSQFSEIFLTKSKELKFDFVLLYSQNSAKNFFKLAKKHNLLEYFQSSRILCLSEKILNLVRSFDFQNSATFDEILILKNFYD